MSSARESGQMHLDRPVVRWAAVERRRAVRLLGREAEIDDRDRLALTGRDVSTELAVDEAFGLDRLVEGDVARADEVELLGDLVDVLLGHAIGELPDVGIDDGRAGLEDFVDDLVDVHAALVDGLHDARADVLSRAELVEEGRRPVAQRFEDGTGDDPSGVIRARREQLAAGRGAGRIDVVQRVRRQDRNRRRRARMRRRLSGVREGLVGPFCVVSPIPASSDVRRCAGGEDEPSISIGLLELMSAKALLRVNAAAAAAIRAPVRRRRVGQRRTKRQADKAEGERRQAHETPAHERSAANSRSERNAAKLILGVDAKVAPDQRARQPSASVAYSSVTTYLGGAIPDQLAPLAPAARAVKVGERGRAWLRSRSQRMEKAPQAGVSGVVDKGRESVHDGRFRTA